MSYPMTWRRVLNRNGLSDGDYRTRPTGWLILAVNVSEKDDAIPEVAGARREVLNTITNKLLMLAGDMRRLETDSVDENATCRHIAVRTGIDPEVVAAVLKEFFAW